MRIKFAVLMAAFLAASSCVSAMTLEVVGNQLVMSGDVNGTEYRDGVEIFSHNPAITMVILRNSHGGNVPVSYKLGRYFREHNIGTAVSGYCVSSCSRLFLGGKTRQFTDDYPPSATQVWFHGHYANVGTVDVDDMAKYGLVDYLVEMSDGHADRALIERWIHAPYNNGGIHFFHPGRVSWRQASTFLCQGVVRSVPRESILGCEAIAKNAVDLGIVTSLELVHSNDQAKLRKNWVVPPPAAGFTLVRDQMELPFRNQAGVMDGFARYLTELPPRAFAITADGAHWASMIGGEGDPRDAALHNCSERFHSTCTLFAVDGQIGAAALKAAP